MAVKEKAGKVEKGDRGSSHAPNKHMVYCCKAYLEGKCTKTEAECDFPHLSQAEVDKRKEESKHVHDKAMARYKAKQTADPKAKAKAKAKAKSPA